MFVGQIAVLSGLLLTSSPAHRLPRPSHQDTCRTSDQDPDPFFCRVAPTVVDVTIRDTGESKSSPCVLSGSVIVPARVGGVSYGIEVRQVRTGSFEELLGLRGGDIALSINGLPLATPEAALAAYSRLKQRSILWLVVRRDRRLVVLTYRIFRVPGGPHKTPPLAATMNPEVLLNPLRTNPVRSSPSSLTHPGR
jgi:hypothetical protein